MDYRFKLALRMLTNKKGSLIGAILAIAIGILVISIITVVLVGLQNAIIRDLGDYRFSDIVISDKKGYIELSEPYLMGWFEQFADVDSVSPRMTGFGDVEIRRNGHLVELFQTPITGIDPNKDHQVSKLFETVIDGEYVTTRNSVVVGAYVAEDLGGIEIGEALDVTVTNRFDEDSIAHFVVTGITQSRGGNGLDNQLIVHIETLRELLSREGETGQFLVKLNVPSSAPLIQEEFLTTFSHEDFNAETVTEAGQESIDKLNSVLGMFTLIGYVGLMSSSFAVVTIQIMLVSSKTREIGIMRSIGEKRSNILIIFVIQGAVIGVMGAVTGLIFGIGFTAYADYSKFSFLGGLILDVEYSWDSLLTTAFMAFCLALGASIYPALKATKLQPLEAMKSV